MNIVYHGKNCLEIGAISKKDGGVNIIINPMSKEESGRKKIKGDILLFSSLENKKAMKEIEKKEKEKTKEGEERKGFAITGPGEYEIKEVFIQGFEISSSETFYSILAEDINICYMGNFKREDLLSSQIEELGNVDILFLPIGKEGGIEPKTATKIMGQLEPKITIPLCKEKSSKNKELKEFLDILGIKSPEATTKFSIKKKSLLEEGSKVVLLEE